MSSNEQRQWTPKRRLVGWALIAQLLAMYYGPGHGAESSGNEGVFFGPRASNALADPGKNAILLERRPGLLYETFGNTDLTRSFGTPHAPDLDAMDNENSNYGLPFTGFLAVSSDGEYAFRVEADTGVRLILGGKTVIDGWARDGCLPRKELYEAWEVARRARRLFRGGRVIDLGGGHGLLAHVMLLLDDSSPDAVVVDPAIPPSARAIHDGLVKVWPRLEGRVRTGSLPPARSEAVGAEPDVIVSCHACGAFTDEVLSVAAEARARVAVLPCCHDEATCDAGPLRGWMDFSLAVDTMRAVRLEQQGARVWTQVIPDAITPKNRLLLADFSALPRIQA